jgi:hypothetical protein
MSQIKNIWTITERTLQNYYSLLTFLDLKIVEYGKGAENFPQDEFPPPKGDIHTGVGNCPELHRYR